MDRHLGLRGLVLGGMLALSAAAMQGAAPGDLSGTWKLNHDASDDPRKKMEEARGQSGGSGGSGWGGGSGSGRHGGHRGGGTSSPEGGSGAMEPSARMETLHIDHKDPKLVVTDAAGTEHVMYTDGRKSEEERSYGGTTKVAAQWKDGHVVVAIEPEHGPSYTETYSVTADGKQLTITTKFKGRGGRGDFEIRRVYDAVPAPTEPDPPSAPEPAVSASEQGEGLAPVGAVRLEP